MAETQGILNDVWDPVNHALRIISAADVVSFPIQSLELVAGARTTVVTHNVPRLVLVDGVITSFAVSFWPPPTWARMGVGFFWTTEGAGAGNVRWRTAVKKTFLFVDNISAAFTAETTLDYAVPSAPGIIKIEDDEVANFDLSPGFFGAYYTLFIERVGGHAGDTFTGDVALLGMYARKNPV